MKIQHYSINLLWLNKNFNVEQKYLYPGKNEEEVKEKYLYSALKWKEANPEGEVKIWYDSELHTADAVDNTNKIISDKGVVLADIRNLDVINKNQPIFTKTFPMYFKIDTLKLIICYYELQTNDAAIYTDILVGDMREDKGRMNKDTLFEAEYIEKCEKYGLVTNEVLAEENQFLQAIKNDYTISTLRHSINIILNRADTSIKYFKEFKSEYQISTFYTIPFYFTIHGVKNIYNGLKNQTLKVNAKFLKTIDSNKYNYKGDEDSKNWEEEDGYDVFGNLHLVSCTTYRDLVYLGQDKKFSMEQILKMNDLSDESSTRKVDVRGGSSHLDEYATPLPDYNACLLQALGDTSNTSDLNEIN